MNTICEKCLKCYKKNKCNTVMDDMICQDCQELGKTKKDFISRLLDEKKGKSNNFPNEVSVITEKPGLNKNGMPNSINLKIDR